MCIRGLADVCSADAGGRESGMLNINMPDPLFSREISHLQRRPAAAYFHCDSITKYNLIALTAHFVIVNTSYCS